MADIMNYESEILALRVLVDQAIEANPRGSVQYDNYDLTVALRGMKEKILVLNQGVIEEWTRIEDMERLTLEAEEAAELLNVPPVVLGESHG